MATNAKKQHITKLKRSSGRPFFELAKKHIVKGKQGGSRTLSKRIDQTVYGR